MVKLTLNVQCIHLDCLLKVFTAELLAMEWNGGFPVKSESRVDIRATVAITFCWEIEQNCYQSALITLQV